MAIIKPASGWILLVTALLISLGAQAGPLPLWEIKGANNRVLLMGSVHFLRQSDYPLPAGLDAAYAEADRLVMEIDMDDLDPLAAVSILSTLGVSTDGKSLRDLLGARDYAEANELANAIGIPLTPFEQFQPWYAALTISQLRMMQLGFDPAWGIETRMTEQAARDGKPIQGLETLEQQLGFMANLDSETQKEFLLQSLQDAAVAEDEIEAIVAAWRSGDTRALNDLLVAGLQDVPELYAALLVRRNQNWVSQIKDLTRQSDDYLVIVGAMHLVGDNSLLRMLASEGLKSRQLTDSDLN